MPVPAEGETGPTRILSAPEVKEARLGEEKCPGESLGSFYIERRLGQGGMGVVYLAEDKQLQRRAAIKVVSRQYADSPMALERLRAEAQAAARLAHPNIISVYSFGEETGTTFIALEFVDGEDLATLVRREGPMDPPRALRIIRQVAEALAYAHERHVIHRDIKPSNIMLTAGDRVKVGDFGLAKRLDQDSGLTSTNMVIGSPHYMAPEQAMGQPVDHRADIYSLGCTLYTILVGTVPFDATTPLAVMWKHSNVPVPDPEALRDPYGGGLLALVRKMMGKLPGDRYQRYSDLIADIDVLLTGGIPAISGPSLGQGTIPAPAPPRRGNKFLLAAVGIAILCVGTGIGLWVRGAAPPGEPPAPASSQPASTPVQTPPLTSPPDREAARQSSAPLPDPGQVAGMVRPTGQQLLRTMDQMVTRAVINREETRKLLADGDYTGVRNQLKAALDRSSGRPIERMFLSTLSHAVDDVEKQDNAVQQAFLAHLPMTVEADGLAVRFVPTQGGFRAENGPAKDTPGPLAWRALPPPGRAAVQRNLVSTGVFGPDGAFGQALYLVSLGAMDPESAIEGLHAVATDQLHMADWEKTLRVLGFVVDSGGELGARPALRPPPGPRRRQQRTQ